MSETVAVVGAGIGGLCTALSLAPTGRHIILLDRDGPPPGEDPRCCPCCGHGPMRPVGRLHPVRGPPVVLPYSAL